MSDFQPELLAGLAPEDAAALLSSGTRVELESGDELFALGANADRLFLIERGRVNLTLPMKVQGHEQDILVEERLAGQTVGWSALIPPHRFTLRATAPLRSELVALPRSALVDYFAAHPAAGYVVLRNLAAVIGQRLQVFQAMWLREMQRAVELQSR